MLTLSWDLLVVRLHFDDGIIDLLVVRLQFDDIIMNFLVVRLHFDDGIVDLLVVRLHLYLEGVEHSCSRPKTVFIKHAISRGSTIP